MFKTNNKMFMNLLLGTALSVGGLAIAAPTQADMETTTTTVYTFEEYDLNNDSYLNEDEYVDYSYTLIDYNNDGVVDETEWDQYTTIWYDPYDVSYDSSNDFSYYDADGDGFIEAVEYEDAYDPDLFVAWDNDNDGYIEEVEYENVAETYIDYDDYGYYTW